MAGAATTVQRVIQWAVESNVRVGEGLGRWCPGAGWVRGSWLRDSAGTGGCLNLRTGLGARLGVRPSGRVTLACLWLSCFLV